LLEADLEVQASLGSWVRVRVQLVSTGLVIDGTASPFQPETRVTIPMRNLKSDAQCKGCAFQVESGADVKTFMAASLAEKNAWARKLNIVLGELRASGAYDAAPGDENSGPITPLVTVESNRIAHSVDRQQKQKAAIQQLAQSLQPKRTAARTGVELMQPAVPSMDRSAEIQALQDALMARETEMRHKEKELSEATQKLQREQQYREQITAGVEKWRQDMTRQKDQKLQDTRERLDQESKRVAALEQEKVRSATEKEAADATIAELEERVQELAAQVTDQEGLRGEISELRRRLEQEVAFVQVLERDTQQMADELVRLSRAHTELKVRREFEFFVSKSDFFSPCRSDTRQTRTRTDRSATSCGSSWRARRRRIWP
jgi:hypothetical protein